MMKAKVSKLALACALVLQGAAFPALAGEQTRVAPQPHAVPQTRAQATAPMPRPHRPNILVIIADDVGLDLVPGMYPGLMERLTARYGADGFNHPQVGRINGHPASTPSLNRMAQQGMVFRQAWAHPFCSPSRASMLTGLAASKTHVATYADALSQSHHSFVADLRDQAGYSTAVFGKWHMAGLPGQPRDYPGMKPAEAGFDYFRGSMHAALSTYWDYRVQVQDQATGPDTWRDEAPRPHSLPGIRPTLLADVGWASDALDWIRQREAADPDKPWFTWLAFNLAHATIRQDPSAMMVPDRDTLDEPTRREIEACGGQYGSQNVGSCSGETLMRAMTNAMDTIIGRVLDEVDRLDPDTYVIFMGDNGTPMYGRPNLDFIDNMYITRVGRGKSSAYEGGAHVPLAIRGPGIGHGLQSDEFVHVTDLFATILQMAALPVPSQVPNSAGTGSEMIDAVSLMPILDGATAQVRDPQTDFIITESTNLMADSIKVVGVRNARYKVVCVQQATNCEFYDLASDPLEEYPLPRPDTCSGPMDAAQPEWNYCRLAGVAASRSILTGTPRATR